MTLTLKALIYEDDWGMRHEVPVPIVIPVVVETPPPPVVPPVEPPVQVGALEASAAFTPARLTTAQKPWYARLRDLMRGKPVKPYPNPDSAASKETKEVDGKKVTYETADIYDVSRTLNIYIGAMEAALRGTSDPAFIEEIWRLLEKARGNMTTRDGHQVWLFWHHAPDDPHFGKYTRAVDETLAFWMVLRGARTLLANGELEAKYSTAGEWWLAYAQSILDRWRGVEPGRPPLQQLDKLLTHCYVSMAGGFRIWGRLTGARKYLDEGERRLTIFREMLTPGPKGGLIWPHTVPGYQGEPQPAPAFDYVSNTVEVLQTLCRDGDPLVDDALMRQITAGVRDNMLHSADAMAMYLDGSGGVTDMRKYAHNAVAGLAPWDETGKLAAINATLAPTFPEKVHIPAYELLRAVT